MTGQKHPGDGPCPVCGVWTWCKWFEDGPPYERPPECDADSLGIRAQARRRHPEQFERFPDPGAQP